MQLRIQRVIIKQMGSGCFKPPSPAGPLNLSFLDLIYEEVRQQNIRGATSNEQNGQTYKQINQSIMKNGKLKKLCDYLTSHRHFICDTVLHCNRLLSQTKCYAHNYVTIIVLDAIFSIGPKLPKNARNGHTETTLIDCNSSKAASTQGGYQSAATRNLVHKEDKERSINNVSWVTGRRKVVTEVSQYEQSKQNTGPNELASPILEANYFNMMNVLIQEDGLLYRLCLQNIIKYCELCQASNSISFQQSHNKFGNKNYIHDVMRNISHHIQVNNQMSVSLKCYRVMLQRMKDEYFNSNIDYLSVLFDLWISASSIPLEGIIANKYLSPQEGQLSGKEESQQLMQILQVFLASCIEECQNNGIAEEILKILDRNKFRNANQIENMVFNVAENNEMKHQFYQKLMLNLLGYAATPECSSLQYDSSTVKTKFYDSPLNHGSEDNLEGLHALEKQWTVCYGMGTASMFGKNYKNVWLQECKLSSLSKINKWVFSDRIVPVEELLMYSGECLLNAFIFNLYAEDQAVREMALSELKSFISNLGYGGKDSMSLRNLRLAVGDMLMLLISENRVYSDSVRSLLLSVWQRTVEKEKELKLDESHAHIIQPLGFAFTLENNMQLIRVMSLVLGKMDRSCVKVHLERICQFYDSLCQEMLTGFTNAYQKIGLLDEFAKYFAPESQMHRPDHVLDGIYAAFLEKLGRVAGKSQSLTEKEPPSQVSDFFIDYLSYTIAKILHLGSPNTSLLGYKKAILSSKDGQQIAILEQYAKQRSPPVLTPTLKEEASLYSESTEYFRLKQSNEYEMTGAASVFWKGARSINSSHSRDDSLQARGDKDLQDVLDILRL